MNMKIDAMVNRIFSTVDRNRNNVLEVGKESTWQINSPWKYAYNCDTFVRSADANNDGKVTKTEMKDLIKSYDTNGDGALKMNGIRNQEWFRMQTDLDIPSAILG